MCGYKKRRGRPISNIRILAVDDEPIILMGIEAIASSLGYDVVSANGVRTAIEELQAHADIDILLSDFEMPNASGADLARQALQICPELSIILVTGRLELDAHLEPGWVALLKPFTPEEMADAVNAVLGRSVDAGA